MQLHRICVKDAVARSSRSNYTNLNIAHCIPSVLHERIAVFNSILKTIGWNLECTLKISVFLTHARQMNACVFSGCLRVTARMGLLMMLMLHRSSPYHPLSLSIQPLPTSLYHRVPLSPPSVLDYLYTGLQRREEGAEASLASRTLSTEDLRRSDSSDRRRAGSG